MDQIEQISKSLQEQLKNIPEDERHEWLRTLHSNYTQRFTTDNERIWNTGAIMIPLSLGGFVAFTSIDNPTPSQAFIIGMVSIFLMLAWIVIAENHRVFQNKSLAWLRAIEREIGIIESYGHKLETNIVEKIFAFRGATQFIRIALLSFVIIGWITIRYTWPF